MKMKNMWPFRRKPEPPQPTKRTERIRIPDDKIDELARLDDAVERELKKGAARAAAVELWRFLTPIRANITNALPKGSTWSASVDWSRLLQPEIVMEITIPPERKSDEPENP